MTMELRRTKASNYILRSGRKESLLFLLHAAEHRYARAVDGWVAYEIPGCTTIWQGDYSWELKQLESRGMVTVRMGVVVPTVEGTLCLFGALYGEPPGEHYLYMVNRLRGRW